MKYQSGDILLNKYLIEEMVGEGAFGQVYCVSHIELGVRRAIKILSRDMPGVGNTAFKETQKRFRIEAQLGASLHTPVQRPNLIQVYDYHHEGELLLLVMEYAVGGSLAERIAANRKQGRNMSIEEALPVVMDIAGGLAVLHECDYVHRDLKPSNVLFDGEGRAKVADLGLAQIPHGPSRLSQLSSRELNPGTPTYMSPEQESTGNYLSPPSDVYALGLLTFEMLTGRVYRNVEPGTRLSAMRPDVPEWLDDLLQRMLDEDPRKRPWNGARVVEALRDGETKHQGLDKKAVGVSSHMEEQQNKGKPVQAKAMQEKSEKAEEKKTGVKVTIPPAGKGEFRPKNKLWLAAIAGMLLLIWGVSSMKRGVESEGALSGLLVAKTATLTGTSVATEKATYTHIPAAIEAATYTHTPAPTKTATYTHAPAATETATYTHTPAATNTPQATYTPEPGIGSTMVSEIESMEMVYVPAGEFLMGSTDAYEMAEDDEKPQHTVNLDAYWIDRTEVTNAMFARFIKETGYKTDAEKEGWGIAYDGERWGKTEGADWQHPQGSSSIAGLDEHPVVQVSWNDAAAYCEWAGKKLPSEAEWEKAARGTDGRKYPWGNEAPSGELLNYDDVNQVDWVNESEDDGYEFTAPVRSYEAGASPYGALDMAGNVWEWVNDWYGREYYSQSPADNPQGPSNGEYRVARGGSWSNLGYLRSAARSYGYPGRRSVNLGFRCARSAVPRGE